MRDHHLEVFPQTSEHSLLRLDGDNENHYLDKDAIAALVKRVEDVYAQGGNAPLTYGSAELIQLGKELYQFLDGDGRWLSKVVSDPPGAVLRIDAEERLRHLPWELMVESDSYLALSSTIPFTPVRSIGTNKAFVEPRQANRPLHILFMATSPEGVEPVLAFEQEEAMILEATANTGAELVVEESGTLDGLRFQADSYGAGYFDVFHLSGHANVKDGQPVFLMEDEIGQPTYATPDDIARAIGGRWPRLIFVSGSLSGNSPDQGDLPSMSESLIKAGAPAVLGWALPVGDLAASQFAAFLYEKLAAGRALHEAVVLARQELYAEKSPFWHFLRLYADRSPFAAMVTPLNTPGRAPLKIRPAGDAFLDPRTRVSRVAARSEFVGRRRLIQRCLRDLKAPLTSDDGYEGIVLHGMGGLGKSTLASRLLERMPTHQRVVYFGKVDDVAFGQQLKKIEYGSSEVAKEAISIIDADAPWETRLRYLLSGPLATNPCVFVFDDFEDGNLEERSNGTIALTPGLGTTLQALLTAIRDNSSSSRVIITSRYRFPAPVGARLNFVALETLKSNELAKKLRTLEHLSPASATQSEIRTRAIDVAANNPRMLEWLNIVVGNPDLDANELIDAIEDKAAEFRENVLAQELIEAQESQIGEMLARINVIEIPIPFETVKAVYPGPRIELLIQKAVDLGLLEQSPIGVSEEFQYYVSNVLRPLLRPKLTDEQYKMIAAAAAKSLNRLWLEEASGIYTPADEQMVEIFRLAVAGVLPEIAHPVGRLLCRQWIGVSRFWDVERISSASLTIGRDAGVLHDLAWAKQGLGFPVEALELYAEALEGYEAAGNRGGVAATLSGIGDVYQGLGQPDQALNHYNQALPTQREIGNRQGEATTLANIGSVYQGLGQPDQALNHYNQALPIQREVGDRQGEATTLNNIGSVYWSLGQPDQALHHYNQALPTFREVGNRHSQAATLNNIGSVYDGLGQPDQAVNHYNQALPIQREIGDRQGEANTLNNIGSVYDGLGQPDQALNHHNQALSITREVGDRQGEATTLNNIGSVHDKLGQPDQALHHYNQALHIRREVGDRRGEAVALNNIGSVYEGLGYIDRALEHYEQALVIRRQIGDRAGEAQTLNNTGSAYLASFDTDKAIAAFREARDVIREVGDLRSEARVLFNLGVLYNQTGAQDLAVATTSEAVQIASETNEPSLTRMQSFLDRLLEHA